MSKVLRPHQQKLKSDVYAAWNSGARVVMGRLATGGGKTAVMAAMAHELSGFGIVEAHRHELVEQISLALADEGVRHNIIGSKETVRSVIDAHMDEFKRSFYDPRANWSVASVDTILRAKIPHAERVNWLFQDEGHHTLRANKWGRAYAQIPNARVFLPTATPCRADQKGLGAHADGIVDILVQSAGVTELTELGYLVPYVVHSHRTADVNRDQVQIGADGELNEAQAAQQMAHSRMIVGDVVKTYKQIALGKLAIVFAQNVAEGKKLAAAFAAANVPAVFMDGTEKSKVRKEAMKKFKRREILVLINVDLFGEGVDVPAVEVVIMARMTASFPLYAQQIGRMLRLDISDFLKSIWETLTPETRRYYISQSAKPNGILIDHVGNVGATFKIGEYEFCGLPEWFDKFDLDGKRKSSKGGAIPTRTCLGPTCGLPYERYLNRCPHCGLVPPPPDERAGPKNVDGDVYMLTPEMLAQMRKEALRIAGEVVIPRGLPAIAELALRKRHHERQAAQFLLQQAIAQWAGFFTNLQENEIAKMFYLKFKMDVLTALSQSGPEMEKLRMAIESTFYTQGK